MLSTASLARISGWMEAGIIQFAGEPPAKIVFELLANYRDIPPTVLAAYMVESIKVLLGRRRKNKPAEQAPDEVVEPVLVADDTDAPSSQAEQDLARLSREAPGEIVAPVEDADKSANLSPAKVTL
jgi:hypothetical protein